jgi:flagellar hook protein FlgE
MHRLSRDAGSKKCPPTDFLKNFRLERNMPNDFNRTEYVKKIKELKTQTQDGRYQAKTRGHNVAQDGLICTKLGGGGSTSTQTARSHKLLDR